MVRIALQGRVKAADGGIHPPHPQVQLTRGVEWTKVARIEIRRHGEIVETALFLAAAEGDGREHFRGHRLISTNRERLQQCPPRRFGFSGRNESEPLHEQEFRRSGLIALGRSNQFERLDRSALLEQTIGPCRDLNNGARRPGRRTYLGPVRQPGRGGKGNDNGQREDAQRDESNSRNDAFRRHPRVAF